MSQNKFNWVNILGGGSSSLFLSGLGCILLVCLARMLGLFEGIELKTLDLMLKWRPPERPDRRITIIEITDADIQSLKTYPVPDATVAELLTELERYHPRVIGLDLFRDIPVINPFEADLDAAKQGHQDFIRLLQGTPEIVVIEKVLNSPVSPPPDTPAENVGFADALLDRDGFARRSLLASPSPYDQEYHFSLTIRLVSRYLAAEGFELENGLKDAKAMRFGQTEFFRFGPKTGGYIAQDTGENPVVLINFRAGPNPFQRLSLREFMAGDFPKEWIEDRIILIGMTAASTKDYVNTAAVVSENPGLVPGVEFQAHAVSQLLSAVLDDRPILKAWATPWEYGWIILAGIAGIGLVHIPKSFLGIPIKKTLSATIAAFTILGTTPFILGYGLVLAGVWIPIVPAWLAFFLNGSNVVVYRLHHREQSLRIGLEASKKVAEKLINIIHSGPLQSLKLMNRMISSQEEDFSEKDLCEHLRSIDEEIRDVLEFIKNNLSQPWFIRIEGNIVDLRGPFYEVLYLVYFYTLQGKDDYFADISQITTFNPVKSDYLNWDEKAAIARILEEMLLNVSGHAVEVNRLEVTCQQVGNQNIIQVIDNGTGAALSSSQDRRGIGTRQAKSLAARLGGEFSRCLNKPTGVICEFSWPVQRLSLAQRLWLRLQKPARQLFRKSKSTLRDRLSPP